MATDMNNQVAFGKYNIHLHSGSKHGSKLGLD